METTSEVHGNHHSSNDTPHHIDLNSVPASGYPRPKQSFENESSSNSDEASYEKPQGQNDANASSKEHKASEQNHDNDSNYISRASSGFDYRESPYQTPCGLDLNYVPAPDHPSPQKSGEKGGRNIVEAAYEKPEGRDNSNPSPEEHEDSEENDDNGSYSPAWPSPAYDDQYSPRYDTFERAYSCYPLSLIEKSHLEQGNQIIMPSSALELLLRTEVEYPMLFEIRNQLNERVSHCGVYEFTAQDGSIFLPKWMMENLQLQDGDIVSLKNTSLEKGTFIKLQPHSMDFLNIQNPKAALEEALSARFFCLTTGDTIKINHNRKHFCVDIIETKPTNAICIIDADCEVDFALPLDYKEPEQPMQSTKAEPSKGRPKFIPFTGLPRRLDEKHAAELNLPDTGSVKQESHAINTNPEFSSRKRPVSMVFGFAAHRNKSKQLKGEDVKAETPMKEQFRPFTGKKYSLEG